MVKVQFPSNMARDEVVETMFAEVTNEGLRLENSPFYVYGVSYMDIVEARDIEGSFVFTGIIKRGGHSTYRLLVNGDSQAAEFLARWPQLEALGCTYEEGGRDAHRLYSVDMAPGVDVQAAYTLMEKGEHEGAWTFEEGHYEPD